MASNTFSWKNLFNRETSASATGELRLRKIDVNYVDGRVVVPDKTVVDSIKRWESFIVGFFIGKKLAYPTVRKHLENKWKFKDPLDLKLENNFFYTKIESEETKRDILEASPIFILGRILVLQQLEPEIEKQR